MTRGPIIVLAALWFATCVAIAGAADSARFPRPDRPVAPIVTSGYSTEQTRDARGEAVRVMNRLGLRPGLRVADIGAGDGYYTVRIARRFGGGATIWAQDVQRPYLDRLAERLVRERITGVTLVHGTPNDPRLPKGAIDVALLAHMYHEIDNPYEFLYRLHAALAPDARVAVIDNDKPTAEHGTPPVLLRCEMAALGYRESDVVSLEPADGYLMVFTPPPAPPAPEAIRPCTASDAPAR